MKRRSIVPIWRRMGWAPTKAEHDEEVERRGRPLTQPPPRRRRLVEAEEDET